MQKYFGQRWGVFVLSFLCLGSKGILVIVLLVFFFCYWVMWGLVLSLNKLKGCTFQVHVSRSIIFGRCMWLISTTKNVILRRHQNHLNVSSIQKQHMQKTKLRFDFGSHFYFFSLYLPRFLHPAVRFLKSAPQLLFVFHFVSNLQVDICFILNNL